MVAVTDYFPKKDGYVADGIVIGFCIAEVQLLRHFGDVDFDLHFDATVEWARIGARER